MPLTTSATKRLGVVHPIVLAPMAGVAGGELAAAVSRAGGLGMIGGGYGDRAWLTDQFARAAGARVGCGFITWSLAQRPELLDLALEQEPVAVMLSFGDPAPFAEAVRASGALLVCQIQDRRQAEHALGLGADVLVAQGTEAGGHGYGTRGTMTLVPEIVDLVAAHGSGTPVLAAGGIADGRGLAASLMLGADGALMGTRYYAAAEALSTAEARARVTAATGDEICRTTVYDVLRDLAWPDGHTMSVLRNDLTARWDGAEAELRRHLDRVRGEYRAATAAHDYAVANVTAGQAVGLVRSTAPAAELTAAVVRQAEAVLVSLGAPT